MSEVKRYKAVINDKPYKPYAYCEESSDGIYVRHDDYAALQQKLDAVLAKGIELAQEAAHVYAEYNKEMAPDVVCDGQTIQEFYDLANGWSSVESYLNELRAEGVDLFISELSELFKTLKTGGKPWHAIKGVAIRGAAFATQLRAGSAEGGV